jgi:16S rRNA (guanine527-N7)-methyltransferase
MDELVDLANTALAPSPDAWPLLRSAVEPMGLEPEPLVERLLPLYEHLLATNTHTNLTRLTQPEAFWVRHVAESLWLASQACPYLEAHNNANTAPPRWADLGTGNGFPLLPMAMAFQTRYPELRWVGIESNQKKVAFIKEAISLLGFEALCQLEGRRAEALASKAAWQGGLSGVVARAVAPLPKLVTLALPLLKPGGR